MPTNRPSKSEQRARRIGKPEVYGPTNDGVFIAHLSVPQRKSDRNWIHFRFEGRTRAEAIRNVLRAADRLATRVERSKR